MTDPPPMSTPKRKRNTDILPAPIKFSFDLARSDSVEDGSSSPSSKVAQKFYGLALGSAGGVAAEVDGTAESPNKRIKPDEEMRDALDPWTGPQPTSCTGLTGHPPPHRDVPLASKETADNQLPQADPFVVASPPPKVKGKKRAGTPPLRFRKGPIMEEPDDSDESDQDFEIVDPVRAALTWHEDEITIYDPDDEDDDGTGINGIGFKPTPAMAQARVMRRRQQMADYRKREEGEARAKRSRRRRGEAAIAAGLNDQSPSRKVRFMDMDRQNVAITTG